MNCSSCQTHLPDDAAFCWRCGTPQKALVKIEPTPLVQRQPSRQQERSGEIIVEVVGTKRQLPGDMGILVIYGKPSDKERVITVIQERPLFNGYTPVNNQTLRMKEWRVQGLSVIAAIVTLPPATYSIVGLGYKSDNEYMVEAGDVTEVDFR